MHDAPAVDYPVAGSRFYRLVLLVAAMAVIGVDMLWLAQAQVMVLHWWLGLGGSTIFCALALRAAGASPDGVLRWAGRSWWRESNGVQCSGTVDVCLDLQNVLLLRFSSGSGPQQWLWLEQTAAKDRWSALRRAVHAAVVAEEGPDSAAIPLKRQRSSDVASL